MTAGAHRPVHRTLGSVLLAGALALLAGCAGPGAQGGRIDRLLNNVANPSALVARESAFSRAMRQDGRWRAYRDAAADDAVLLRSGAVVPAKDWLKGRAEPAQAPDRDVQIVWSSCDGTLGVTRGAFDDPQTGARGEFYTVWQRDRRGRQHWVFDGTRLRDALPEPPEFIATDVADCGHDANGERLERPAPPPRAERGEDTQGRSIYASRDESLRWSVAADGRFTVSLRQNGAMAPVVDIDLSTGEGAS